MTADLATAAAIAALVVIWVYVLRRMFPARRDHRDLGRTD